MDSLPTSFGRGGGRINSSAGGRNPNHRGGGGRGRGGGGRNNFRGGGHARGGGRGRFYNNNFARGGGGRGPRGGGGGRGRFGRGGRMPPPQNRHHDISKDFIEVIGERSDNSLCIAVEGCCHGELDNIYRRLEAHEQMTGQKVDLLLCCGDFQSLRNAADFHSTSIPPKYRSLGTFPDYYSGAKRAPILTLFIGGNHEASQPLRELHYGGWMAPNIYYMGTAGVVRFGGIRIGGMSGIYSKYDYELGHFERPPLERGSLKSIYHVRNVDVYRLKCLSKSKSRLDIMMSHDWPLGIEQHGDTDGLIRRKPFFRKEIEENDLGSPPNREVMDTVKPKWWFSAHLHVKFRASLDHNKKNESTSHTAQDSTGKPSVTAKKSLSSPTSSSFIPSQVSQAHVDKVKSEDETNATDNNHDVPKDTTNNNDMKEESENVTEEQDNSATEFIALASNSSNRCTGPDLTDLMTQFLALDKCLPRRQYLSILNVPTDITKADAVLEYDPDWLAILRKTHDLTCTERKNVTVPDELIDLTDSDIEWVEARIKEQSPSSDLSIPENFSATVPEQSHPMFQGYVPPIPIMGNPQTDALLKILELEHVLTVPYSTEQTTRLLNPESYRQPIQPREPDMNIMVEDENEIDLGLEEDGVDDNLDAEDENEIDIDDDNIMVDGEDEEKEEESPPAPDGGKVESAPAKKPRLDDE